MIKDKMIAKNISELMLEYSERLNSSLMDVKENCTIEEYETYRKGFAHVMGEMLIRIMNPLYTHNPDLKPEDLYIPGIG